MSGAAGWLRPFWWSGLTVAAVFVVCSPYVLLGWSSVWGSIAAMGGAEHMMGEGHRGEGAALWHHLRYKLRYGVGFWVSQRPRASGYRQFAAGLYAI